jgi:surface antigen
MAYFSFLSTPTLAIGEHFELLAGVEAGIDTIVAMTESDLAMTQEILSTSNSGTAVSWYNAHTTTEYNLTVGQHYNNNLRPCVSYELITKHSSLVEGKSLNACLNFDGNWISMIDVN